MMLKIVAGALVCVAIVVPRQTTAQEPTLPQVLARAGVYVLKLHTQLSGIVAEETYEQRARQTQRRTNGPGANAGQQKTLKSDLLLVRPPDVERYIEFRDVFEVNGTAVRDRRERLTKLFLTPTIDSANQIKAIADESARHNIGDVRRNINTPMLSLHFLLPHVQQRFRFRRTRPGAPELANATDFPRYNAEHFVVSGNAWVIEFNETGKPTLITTTNGADFPARGRFWIEPETGALLLSELVMRNEDLTAIIDVSFQAEQLLGFRVPMQMRERYRGALERVEGIATYGRFRQFQVKTDQNIQKPPGR
jgi:hypothetical protein